MSDYIEDAANRIIAQWRDRDINVRDAYNVARAYLELRERVSFIESKIDIEDMPEEYAWAVNELTARKAYSKSEVATLLAEQRRLAQRRR